MANFEGYLFATLNSDGNIKEKFPSEYIALETWSSTPNQREELKADRDDNTRDLIRVTAQGKKSVFSFTTRKGLHLSDKKRIQKFFTDAETNSSQRNVSLRYWNEEENRYKDGSFYRPNMTFPIHKITETDIIYKELKFELIEN